MNPLSAQRSDRYDAAGTLHDCAHGTPRIVSLVPSVTELLFELDLGAHVVGRTTFCVHPAPAIESVPRVGGTKTLHLDKLRQLAPTHVIVNVDENRLEDVEAMREFVPHIIVTHPLEPEDNLPLFRLLGGVFDRLGRADALAADFAWELEQNRASHDTLEPRKVLYLIWKAAKLFGGHKAHCSVVIQQPVSSRLTPGGLPRRRKVLSECRLGRRALSLLKELLAVRLPMEC